MAKQVIDTKAIDAAASAIKGDVAKALRSLASVEVGAVKGSNAAVAQREAFGNVVLKAAYEGKGIRKPEGKGNKAFVGKVYEQRFRVEAETLAKRQGVDWSKSEKASNTSASHWNAFAGAGAVVKDLGADAFKAYGQLVKNIDKLRTSGSPQRFNCVYTVAQMTAKDGAVPSEAEVKARLAPKATGYDNHIDAALAIAKAANALTDGGVKLKGDDERTPWVGAKANKWQALADQLLALVAPSEGEAPAKATTKATTKAPAKATRKAPAKATRKAAIAAKANGKRKPQQRRRVAA